VIERLINGHMGSLAGVGSASADRASRHRVWKMEMRSQGIKQTNKGLTRRVYRAFS
jgi:hypothetical protein